MFSNFQGRQGMSIFNRRRRPRQAVYASPQSQSTTTSLQIDIPDETLAEFAQDFENSPKNYNHFASNTKPLSSHNSYARPSPQSGYLLTPQKHPNNQYSNENFSPKKAKFEQERYFKGSNDNSFGQQRSKAMATTGSYPSNVGNTLTTKPQNSTKRNFSFENSTSKLQQSAYFGEKSQYSWNRSPNNPAKATAACGVNARQPTNNDRASFGTPMMNQNSKNENKTVKNEANHLDVSGETSFSLQTVDKSMKFVTTTIQGVRRWSKYRDYLPLVFEIFVTLDSVPTSNNNGTAKLFNIKDSSGSNRCIFWEMDQKLPRMARGQLYRLVGALERKTGHFQCFTIRRAQPHEQLLAKQQVEMCDNAMSKLIALIAES